MIDIEEYEKMPAAMKLISALEEGERSARENGWMTLDDVKRGQALQGYIKNSLNIKKSKNQFMAFTKLLKRV